VNYTPKQLQILRTIYQYQQQHHYSPTYAELAQALHVTTITIYEHLEALERKGAIRRRRHEARSVELVAEKCPVEIQQRAALRIRGTLVSGGVAAAVTLDPTEEMALAAVFGVAPNMYALRVSGSSMAEDHVLDGDVIIVSTCSDGGKAANGADIKTDGVEIKAKGADIKAGGLDGVKDGETVVALDERGQPRLKRLYREGRKIRLQALNPASPPVVVDRVHIEGIFKGLVRKAR